MCPHHNIGQVADSIYQATTHQVEVHLSPDILLRVYSGDARGWWWWLQEPVGLTAVLIAVTCLALGLLRAFGRTA